MPVHILTRFEFWTDGTRGRNWIERDVNAGGHSYLRKAQELAQSVANQKGCTVQARNVANASVVAIVHPDGWSR